MSVFKSLMLFPLVTLVVAKQCENLTIPITTSAENPMWDLPTFKDNLDVTAFIQHLTRVNSSLAPTGHQNITGTYSIEAQFCRPDTIKGSNNILQFLIHGMGFDKSYWDYPFEGYHYSYVDVAVDEYNFFTIAIDRPGIGSSSIEDPLKVLQMPVELSVIYEMTKMLRTSALHDIPYSFSKIIHVGHSFGSSLIYNLASQYPTASDALILTGFSLSGSYVGTVIAGFDSQIASLNQPLRFGTQDYAAIAEALAILGAANETLAFIEQRYPNLGVTLADVELAFRRLKFEDLVAGFEGPVLPTTRELPTGYITWADIEANQFAFFYRCGFDPAILKFAEKTKQPFATGELLTVGTKSIAAPLFKGSVLVLAGNGDAIYCGGDCLATGSPNVLASVKTGFPAASAFEAHVHPNAGHAINLHYNATGAYTVMQEFLISSGLQPS